MELKDISRRSVLKGGSAALAGLTLLHVTGPERAFGQSGAEVIPWQDQPGPNPVPGGVGNLLEWQQLSSWQTPAQNFSFVNHYGPPASIDESTWRLDIGGLVAHPRSLTLADLTRYCVDAGVMRQKIPEQLEIVESLPRNATGKVLKHELRARFV